VTDYDPPPASLPADFGRLPPDPRDARIADLEAHIRRSIACIEGLTPYVMWDGIDGEDEQAKVEVTLTLLREALKQ
jgi:hypothetical protein